jgi:chromosomal replication initiator protein
MTTSTLGPTGLKGSFHKLKLQNEDLTELSNRTQIVKKNSKCYVVYAPMKNKNQLEVGQWPEIWESACRLLEERVVPNQLQAWIQPLEFREFEETPKGLRVNLSAPNDFSAQWVRDHYEKAIEAALAQVLGTVCELALQVDQGLKTELKMGLFDAPESTEAPSQPTLGSTYPAAASAPAAPTRFVHEGPDPRYTFDSFVVGASNQFAHASAVAVAEQPARQYNPLFLYSPPGLGKTHLLHAIGNRLVAHNPRARVAYLSAEKFVNELIDSLQHRRMPQFRSKYRDSFDMILIDDIQFIAGKNTSEEEFFHTFNALHSSKRQIVVTSDRPPKEIEGLEERVRTRFEWGLVADISPPEIETRIAILKAKAERDDIYLPDEVATFLASYIKSNVRELEGVLIRLQAQASLTGAEISLEMAKHELRNYIPDESQVFTVESIQFAVAKHYHMKLQDFKSPTRAQNIALPRQIAMYLIRKYTGMGFKEIGQYFGGKDHTTILHACNKIETCLDGNTKIREAVESIQNLL